jgi:hypothetical protein
METLKPWEVINSGKVRITKGIIGKSGQEKPHISFWVDEQNDVRVAIWIDDNGLAYFQVTKNNSVLKTSKTINPTKNTTISNETKEDDLPF